VHEQCVVGPRTDHAYLDRIIPAGEAIEAVDPVADIEIVAGTLAVDGEGERFDRQIDLAPPDIGFGAGMFDQPLVLRRATGFGSGVGYQRAILGNAGVLFVADGVLVERAWREVAVDFSDGNAIVLKVEWVSHKYSLCSYEGVFLGFAHDGGQ
jgi:hypothetical protein